MTDTDAISAVIKIRDGTDPALSSNSPRRAQLTEFLNQMDHYIHWYRPWHWTFGDDEITILAGEYSADLPDDFGEMGRDGGVYDAAAKTEYFERSRYVIDRIRILGGATTYPRWFCIDRGQLALPYNVSANLTLRLHYRVRPEVYVDDDTEMLLPDKYIRSVIIPALTRSAQQSKSDPRPDWSAELKDGLAQMCMMENPTRATPIPVPRAYGGRGW